MRLSGLNLPLIAFCDSNNDLRVAACNNDACTSAAISPVLVAGVGKGPLSTAGQYGGVQLSMAVQSCQSNLPLIAYTSTQSRSRGGLGHTTHTIDPPHHTPHLNRSAHFCR